MKSLINKFLLFAAVGSFVLLYSCGEDEPETPTADAPSISYTATGGTANAESDTVTTSVGSTITWNFTITAPGGFNTFRIPEASFEQTRDDLGLDAGATSATINGVETPADQAGFATITLTAVDDLNQVTEFEVVIEITGTPARTYSATLLYIPDSSKESETFFSSNTGDTWTLAEVNAPGNNSINIDFGWYWGTTSEGNLASPAEFTPYDLSAEGWGAINETQLKTTSLTAADFAEVTTWEAIADAYDNASGTAAGKVSGINSASANAQVIAFETDADKDGGAKKGLILITAVVDANENGEFDDVGDYVQIDVVVQEAAN